MCSITVNITNNTEQGPITFNSFSFCNDTGLGFSPDGPPYTVATNIQADGTAVQALYAYGYLAGIEVLTSGTAIFNLPNGDLLTIEWELNPESDENKTPTLTPSSNTYNCAGISTPTISNGNDYVFNVAIS